MGVGPSGTAHGAILIVAVAVVYLTWKSGQLQLEMRALRNLLEACVSLHELEDQVMPALESLDHKTAKLKHEMQALARDIARTPVAQPSPEAEGKSTDADFSEQESFEELAELALPQLLMGSLLSGNLPVLLLGSDARSESFHETNTQIESDDEDVNDDKIVLCSSTIGQPGKQE